MAQQLVPAVKGTRDFYPEQMAFRNWLYGKIKEISQKYGYQEFDGPEIEYLELYSDKTNLEILEKQAFTLKDRDNKTLLLRPELTPTFARMVAQKAGQLPKQIRWFAFGRTWRYEQPQKGRGREFFQWELNILGPESPEADAEALAIAAEYLRAVGLKPGEVVIRVSDREFMQNELKSLGVSVENIMPILRIIDRKEKITPEQFAEDLKSLGISSDQVNKLNQIFEDKDYNRSPWLSKVFESLKLYAGVSDYIEFDPSIARGFEYYTRTVFEAWMKTGSFRALFGGGRFDNLTAQVGGERVPGVGFACGDMIIQAVLEDLGRMPEVKPIAPKVLVTVFSENLYKNSLRTADELRGLNIDTELWIGSDTKLEKQLKYADQKGIPYVIIIGPDEAANGKATLKDLNKKSQETLTIEQIIDKLS